MIETKKISELSVLEQVTEQTYLLVEQEGKACRLPISVLGEYLGNTSEPETKEITFKVYANADPNDVVGTDTAVEGMTWRKWIEDGYAPEGWHIQDDGDGHWMVYSPYSGIPLDCGTKVENGVISYESYVSADAAISPDKYYFYK